MVAERVCVVLYCTGTLYCVEQKYYDIDSTAVQYILHLLLCTVYCVQYVQYYRILNNTQHSAAAAACCWPLVLYTHIRELYSCMILLYCCTLYVPHTLCYRVPYCRWACLPSYHAKEKQACAADFVRPQDIIFIF